MVEDALGQGRLIGMIQPRHAAGETVGDTDPVYEVGCLGRITQFSETPDGRFGITLTGVCRFHLRRELDMVRGYRRVAPDFSPFLSDLEPPAGGLADRAGLERARRAVRDRLEIPAVWEALGQSSDAELVTSMVMGCPFGPEEKQALLEADDLPARADRLQSILEMSAHEGAGSPGRH